MSLSNPNQNKPSPSTRWFEWRGGNGTIRYYDKDTKKAVEVAVSKEKPFKFIVLDKLATVKGYSKRVGNIFSNEVRDTRSEPLVVKSKDGGKIAEGLWSDIKEKVQVARGGFCINLYIAFKAGDKLAIGVLQIKGCSLGPWIDFHKSHRDVIENGKKSVSITGFTTDTTGEVEFAKPEFGLSDITPESYAQAKALDGKLQEHFAAYFSKPTVARAEEPPQHDDPDPAPEPATEPPPEEDSVPF